MTAPKSPSTSTLLKDLEEIRQSLDKIAQSEPVIPTLEEVVGRRAPTAVNPNNPFLSSSSLSELINIRNQAEQRAAEELARLKPVRPIEEILKPRHEQLLAPDPEQILAQMESLFENWVENTVNDYMHLFESELRNRLQQDFRTLVGQWYEEHNLPIPESFRRSEASAHDKVEDSNKDA